MQRHFGEGKSDAMFITSARFSTPHLGGGIGDPEKMMLEDEIAGGLPLLPGRGPGRGESGDYSQQEHNRELTDDVKLPSIHLGG